MYKVLKYFRDLQDDGYVYHTGDPFPRMGHSVSASRIAELASSNNRRGIALIIEEKAGENPGAGNLAPNFDTMTRAQLLSYARLFGVDGINNKMKKAEMLKILKLKRG